MIQRPTAVGTPVGAQEALNFILADIAASEPGAAAAIVEGDGRVCSLSAGLARIDDGLPFTASTLCRIASLSKPMAAQVALTLVDHGSLALEEPVGAYLPFLTGRQREPTLRQILSMKSGIREDFALVRIAAGDGAMNDHSIDQRTALIAAQKALNFEPGSRTLYSNANYLLLQRICERAAGESFGELLRRYVFEPAGMQTAAFSQPCIAHAGLGLGYEKREGAFALCEAAMEIGAAGGVVASLNDLIAWRRWNRGAAAALWRRVVEPQRHTDGSESGYGLGIGRQRLSDRLLHCHAGGLGGWASDYLDFPEEDLTVIVLSNRNDLSWSERAREAAVLALGLPPDGGATPRLVSATPTSIDWTAPYGSEQLGYSVTFSGGANELHFEHRRMVGPRFSRTLGVEPFWFDPGAMDDGSPAHIDVVEGNIAARFHRGALADPPSELVGVFECEDLPGSLVVSALDGETAVSLGPDWPAPRRYRLRRVLERLYTAYDAQSGKAADLHLVWSADAPDRIELSMSRISRLPYRRAAKAPDVAARWRFDSLSIGDPT